MKLLLVAAVIVFASVFDMLFANSHHVLMFIETTKDGVENLRTWGDQLWSALMS